MSNVSGFLTVHIPKDEYEELVRESEKLSIIKAMLEANNYIPSSDFKAIVGIKEKDGDSNESV